MLEILHQLSNNQMVLLGCAGAVGASILLLSITFHANPANRTQSSSTITVAEKTNAQEQNTKRRAA